MQGLIFYMKRLHFISGSKLYVNMIVMMLISSIEGFAIYLLVPLLGITGLVQIGSLSIPLLGHVTEAVQSIPEHSRLLVMIAVYVALIMAQSLVQRSQTIQGSRIQQAFIRAIRLETYRNLLQANWSLYLRTRKSDIHHILNFELVRVILGTNLVLKLASTIVFMSIQIGFALWLSYKLTIFVTVCGLLLALFSRRFTRRAKQLGEETTDLNKHYVASITDHFNGIKEVKTNMLEVHHYRWFKALCRQLESNMIRFVKLQTNTQQFYKITSAILIGSLIYFSFEVLHVQGGQLLLIVVIFSRLWPKFQTIQSSWESLASSLPAFTSLMKLHKECAEAREMNLLTINKGYKPIGALHGIECRGLHYRYQRNQSEYALHNINVFIPARGMTAIVGKSGAGKSTLIDLLIGLIQPEKGEVLFDDIPLSSHNLLTIRRMFGFVSQDPFLFHASVRDNLLLVAPDAAEEQLWEALSFSAADEFVRKLPQGLDTIIGDRGIRLSGGERQRIVLARAILRKPSILVLDEATSALDHENEAKIQAALERLKGTMTVIVIAHRLSTIRNADQVIVLEEGRVVQQGSYMQLSMELRGSFSKLLAYQQGAV
ncbi:ABC transporter ATP-binding protein [Paenibacillus xylaniclasticus]|uniref:ABC transporter ATP-binding protein n=1 Tax=Paenibacillus xylaniclasticus TaxID=588083 RepID=UPI000FDB1E56|nr:MULTISPECIES: ABC transporter ATP-binding protein [Paenibacillus]GFN29846.1 ABC transporter ATP-binding protein [Paenibacillus curdlanolyticus]